ncbi:Succinate dehydrogenase [ubiquinone] cytochrome b small subunit, mitochondrial [Lamellibrachia satsuma]|nr:Succinate dehydrogenase [ubiquinone] cytochrome b small subunit, mitochondrial [Lamellibrachia satsuma]
MVVRVMRVGWGGGGDQDQGPFNRDASRSTVTLAAVNMATLTQLRGSLAGKCFLSKALGNALLTQTTPVTGVIVPHKTLTLSPVVHKRIYGPPEIGMPTHTSHWKNERILDIFMAPLIPATVIFPNPVFDMALSTLLCLHINWGLEGVVTDYIHGEVLPKIMHPTVLALSIATFAALCMFNYTDVGIGQAIRTLYSQF